jgi:hypothetical protein
MSREEALAAVFADHLGRPSTKRTKRHPLEVTSDRLGDATQTHYDELWDIGGGALMDEIAHVRDALEQIASR